MTRIEGFIEHMDATEAILINVDRTRKTVQRHLLPRQAQMGDFVFQADDMHFQIDPVRTEKRRRDMRRMAENCQD